ncbi:hypothetical protein BC828DRAFT_380150 [Blastocladiella britannica]|nr:hypothetical protein BC828DRAFT_380150 [Blastocladiella britannica]
MHKKYQARKNQVKPMTSTGFAYSPEMESLVKRNMRTRAALLGPLAEQGGMSSISLYWLNKAEGSKFVVKAIPKHMDEELRVHLTQEPSDENGNKLQDKIHAWNKTRKAMEKEIGNMRDALAHEEKMLRHVHDEGVVPGVVEPLAVMKDGRFALKYANCGSLAMPVFALKYENAPKPTLAAVAYIFLRLMVVMAGVHARGIAHRDLKWQNVFVHKDETGTHEVIVGDFGIASELDDEPQYMGGTPGYCSYNQFDGGAADASDDQYALGTMLVQLVCGHNAAIFEDVTFEDITLERETALAAFEYGRMRSTLANPAITGTSSADAIEALNDFFRQLINGNIPLSELIAKHPFLTMGATGGQADFDSWMAKMTAFLPEAKDRRAAEEEERDEALARAVAAEVTATTAAAKQLSAKDAEVKLFCRRIKEVVAVLKQPPSVPDPVAPIVSVLPSLVFVPQTVPSGHEEEVVPAAQSVIAEGDVDLAGRTDSGLPSPARPVVFLVEATKDIKNVVVATSSDANSVVAALLDQLVSAAGSDVAAPVPSVTPAGSGALGSVTDAAATASVMVAGPVTPERVVNPSLAEQEPSPRRRRSFVSRVKDLVARVVYRPPSSLRREMCPGAGCDGFLPMTDV